MTPQKALRKVASICFKVIVFVMIVLGIVSLGQTAYHYTHAVFRNHALEEAPGRNVSIQINEDVSTKKLSEVLEKNGLIEDAKVFQIQMKLADFEGPVKKGIYELNTSMSPSEMLKILSSNGDET